jgi:peroxiredoxin
MNRHARRISLGTLFAIAGIALAACAHDGANGASPPAGSAVSTSASASTTAPTVPATAQATSPASPESPLAQPGAVAAVGKPAPDFALVDLDGRTVHLHDYAGKVVVLEWFNPKCPFVNAAHTKASLKGMAARREAQGTVWLAINSAGEGKQGFGAEETRAGKQRFGLDHPILLDPTGAVGHAYGATNTPHMFVVDAAGTLVYRGAIDNSPDGEGESPTGGKLVNYVDQALDDLAAKRAVAVSETKAYGCSVKYR